MDKLPENIYLKFNPDTITNVRKILDLDKPGQIDEAIDILDSWAKKQSHFVRKHFPREFWERSLIQSKGSVERAKIQHENTCTFRTLLPHYFEKCDAKNDYKILEGFSYKALMPKLTDKNIRILVSRYSPPKYWGDLPKLMTNEYFHHILIIEYIKAHDYNDGFMTVIDIRNVSVVDAMPYINYFEVKQMCSIVLEGYSARMKGCFFITSSKAFAVVVKTLKKILREKTAKKIHVVKEVEELHEHIPKEVLPSDYGGLEKTFDVLCDEFMEEISSDKNIENYKEMSKCKTIESLRTSTKCHEYFSDLAGSFKTLNID